eukprot:TRINITY_DN50229_c0_g1_i1.p1 TRINITY_DN50229_c0_g1~~TRINITY_DN50229_c0_g1_i1.p1  ORF type:complete len:1059 (+),score=218.23 TRINITY_DN50229_c0_g1_i1:80-3256(+)
MCGLATATVIVVVIAAPLGAAGGGAGCRQLAAAAARGSSCSPPEAVTKAAKAAGTSVLSLLARAAGDETALESLWGCAVEAAAHGRPLWAFAAAAYARERMGKAEDAADWWRCAPPHPALEEWHVLGPFIAGKMEVDGDPVESYGGVEVAAAAVTTPRGGYASELAQGGRVAWRTVRAPNGAANFDFAAIAWQDLIRATSTAVLEWQAWLYGVVWVAEEGDYRIRAQGFHTVWVGDSRICGDQYSAGRITGVVRLGRGRQVVRVRLKAKHQGRLSVSIDPVSKAAPLVLHAPYFLPDVVNGVLFGDWLAVTLASQRSDAPIQIDAVRVEPQSTSWGTSVGLHPDGQDPLPAVAPGQVLSVPIRLQLQGPGCPGPFTVAVDAGGQTLRTAKLTLRCRDASSETFVFTYRDYDGAVTHAGAASPVARGQPSRCTDGCPVVMSFHGTSVEPGAMADAYKQRRNDGTMVFGVANAWLLTPSRHGAHNWEGPGRLSAATALLYLEQRTRELGAPAQRGGKGAAQWDPALAGRLRADASRVLAAGHSMGGHGAWAFATRHPEVIIGVAPTAGWLRKEKYGDSNEFYALDVQEATTEPWLKAVLEASFSENDVDAHLDNIAGAPVALRVGARDATVSPWYSRRAARVLHALGYPPQLYKEVKGQEHWWWDTESENDGGVVNDGQARGFLASVVAPKAGGPAPAPPLPPRFAAALSHPAPLPTAAARANGSAPLLASAGRGGVRVLQQQQSFRRSWLSVEHGGGEAAVSTVNVARLSVSLQRGAAAGAAAVAVDGQRFEAAGRPQLTLCAGGAGKSSAPSGGPWEECDGAGQGHWERAQKSPLNSGPMPVPTHRPLTIIHGAGGGEREAAVYIANLLHMASYAPCSVVASPEDAPAALALMRTVQARGGGVLLVGGPRSNTASAALQKQELRHPGVRWEQDGSFSLAGCRFAANSTGVLHWGVADVGGGAGGAGLLPYIVAAGSDRRGFDDVVSLATPTIPPMVRSPFTNMLPDYVVTGPRFRRDGTGGYLAAGFWSNDWVAQREVGYLRCPVPPAAQPPAGSCAA